MADVICYDDLDEFGRDLDDPLLELEQDVVHMLLEGYGTNVSAPERSLALDDALGGASAPNLRHWIETKLTDDPRIDAVECTLTDEGNGSTRIALRLQVDGDELGITLIYDAAGNVARG
mgnify:CR=1 FL=1